MTGLFTAGGEPGGGWSPRYEQAAAAVRLPGARVPGLVSLLAVPALLVVLIPAVVRPTAGQAPTLHAAVETILTIFSAAATGLMLHQFSRHHRLTDLLLAGAGATMALLNLAVIGAPAVLALNPGGQFAAAGLWGGLFAGCALAAAAWTPPNRVVTHVRHPVRLALGASVVLTLLAELAGLVLRDELVGSTSPYTVTAGDTLGHPLTFVLVVGAMGAFLVGAAGFAHHRRDRGRGFSDLLTAAALLRAGASFSLFIVYALPAGHASPNAELRTIAVALILAAAVHRELGARRVLTRAVALAERRRVARDLHDGLAQDLAFIVAHASTMADHQGREHPLAVAARNALAISRGAISELSDPAGATTPESLEAVAQELRDRFEVNIAVNTQLDQELSRPARETLTRISREAIANAARHGDAHQILVSVTGSAAGVTLRVIDDGTGIATAGRSAATEGFGLRSIRERAEALGGGLSIRPARRGGTELEVTLP
jgi:signal transduction histidine kinase